MKSKKKQNPKSNFKNCIGKRTFLELVWKDWRKERPRNGERIYIVLKSEDGFVPVTGIYRDETLSACGSFKKSRWQVVRFDDLRGMAILDGENSEYLFAWAKPIKIGNLLND